MSVPAPRLPLRSSAAALLLLGLIARPARARSAAGTSFGPADPLEFEVFLDQFFARQMKDLHIPGAVCVLVKNGRIFFAKGYGYANLAETRTVDPARTVFRVASVSKVFTATAVMQLAERGQVNLNDNVNKYLKPFQLENNFPTPVTLANLLTHTAGFDERFIGTAARTPAELVPLGAYLATHLPPRVLPPGEVISYSNHGFALAGYIVESVSRVPFALYMEQNILQPLGMRRSSFGLPTHLAQDVAVGYEYRRGAYVPVPFDYLDKLAPAGALVSTGTDMARFMIAHLQDGRCEDARILTEATVREMHRQHFTQHPRLPGFAYGFYEHDENQLRALAHGGSWRGFASLLYLLPEKNLGLFVSCNRQQPKLVLQLVSEFLDRYFPAPEQLAPQLPATSSWERTTRFSGSYRSTRYARRTIEKLAWLMAQFRVTGNDDGTLTVRYSRRVEKPTRWVQVEPLLFRRVDGEGCLAFRQDAQGRITHLFLQASGSPVALEKIVWYESAEFQFGLLSFIFFFFLSAGVGWPTRWIVHMRRQPKVRPPRLARVARLWAGVVSASNAVFFMVVALAFLDVPWLRLEYGIPRWLVSLFAIPLLTTALTLALPVFTVMAWKKSYWRRNDRLHYTLITLAALLFIPFLLYWNLLGFRF